MGAAAVLAQDAPDDKRKLYAASLDMAAVGAVTDKGALAAAGTGQAERIDLIHGVIIRFWGNGVVFTEKYGYHSLAGGIHFYGCPRCNGKAGADCGRWAPAFFFCS